MKLTFRVPQLMTFENVDFYTTEKSPSNFTNGESYNKMALIKYRLHVFNEAYFSTHFVDCCNCAVGRISRVWGICKDILWGIWHKLMNKCPFWLQVSFHTLCIKRNGKVDKRKVWGFFFTIYKLQGHLFAHFYHVTFHCNLFQFKFHLHIFYISTLIFSSEVG